MTRLPPDEVLVERIRSGDERVVTDLLAAYWDPLVRFAEGILDDPASAEDVVQEVFIRLWAQRERWGAEGSVRALLYTMTRHGALDELRRHDRRDRVARRAEPAPGPASPSDDALASELRSAVVAAIAALPPRRQEVFRLVREQGLTYKEIARVLDVSPQTVANQMSLALADLRKSLAPVVGGRPTSPGREPGATRLPASPPEPKPDW